MVSIAADGRSGMSVMSSTGTALRAARVVSASARPLSSTEGWMPRGRGRRPGVAPAGRRRGGGAEPVVQRGGVDAAGGGPQLGDRLDGAALGVVHELGDPGEVHWGGVSSELLLWEPQLPGQAQQVGIVAVV